MKRKVYHAQSRERVWERRSCPWSKSSQLNIKIFIKILINAKQNLTVGLGKERPYRNWGPLVSRIFIMGIKGTALSWVFNVVLLNLHVTSLIECGLYFSQLSINLMLVNIWNFPKCLAQTITRLNINHSLFFFFFKIYKIDLIWNCLCLCLCLIDSIQIIYL